MAEDPLQYFGEAISLVHDGFYMDAIERLQTLVNRFPESDLADDALYNVALCYYELNQFTEAESHLVYLRDAYPDAQIDSQSALDEHGRTAARAHYLSANCSLAQGHIGQAEASVTALQDYSDSYVIKDGKRIAYGDLAQNAIDLYKSLTHPGS